MSNFGSGFPSNLPRQVLGDNQPPLQNQRKAGLYCLKCTQTLELEHTLGPNFLTPSPPGFNYS